MGTQPSSDAVVSARLAMSKWKIPASVQLAQWAEESDWGQKPAGPFNFFNMKALTGQPCVMIPTTEWYKGVKHTGVLCAFRKFDSAAQSFDAHAKLLATGSPYADFRAKLPDIFAAVQMLGGGTPQHPRYATDPAYGDKLTAVIKGSNLTQYDKGIV